MQIETPKWLTLKVTGHKHHAGRIRTNRTAIAASSTIKYTHDAAWGISFYIIILPLHEILQVINSNAHSKSHGRSGICVTGIPPRKEYYYPVQGFAIALSVAVITIN